MNQDTLFDAIQDTYEHRADFISRMKQSSLGNAVETIADLIDQYASR